MGSPTIEGRYPIVLAGPGALPALTADVQMCNWTQPPALLTRWTAEGRTSSDAHVHDDRAGAMMLR